MSSPSDQQQVVKEHGAATGRITGINHIVLFVGDLDEAVTFYRDVLGLKVVRTQPRFSTNALSLQGQALMSSGDLGGESLVDFSVRQVFFQMGNGELFSVYEVDGERPEPDASVVSFLWPDDAAKAPTHPAKLDHLSFDVASKQDVIWGSGARSARGSRSTARRRSCSTSTSTKRKRRSRSCTRQGTAAPTRCRPTCPRRRTWRRRSSS